MRARRRSLHASSLLQPAAIGATFTRAILSAGCDRAGASDTRDAVPATNSAPTAPPAQPPGPWFSGVWQAELSLAPQPTVNESDRIAQNKLAGRTPKTTQTTVADGGVPPIAARLNVTVAADGHVQGALTGGFDAAIVGALPDEAKRLAVHGADLDGVAPAAGREAKP